MKDEHKHQPPASSTEDVAHAIASRRDFRRSHSWALRPPNCFH